MCKQETRVRVRPVTEDDVPAVYAIEVASFEFVWSEEDFERCGEHSECMVAEHEEQVVGFMIYDLHADHIRVLNFAVLPEQRRRGVGTQMVAHLFDRLSARRCAWIMLEIRESNLTAQLFFRANGFRFVAALRDFYTHTPEDAYLMQYKSEDWRPENRITKYLKGIPGKS